MSVSRFLAGALSVLAAVCPPHISFAGSNPDAKLAMHLVASKDSLAWETLVPSACDSINVDMSLKELEASDGYGYVLFLAYHADSLSGAEFAVDGWPTGRGAPLKQGPYWCAESPLSLGNVFDDGEIVALGECAEPHTDGIVPLGYIFFGPLDEEDLPIDLSYVSSTYSYPDSGHNYVLGCGPDFAEHGVATHSGCTIGGTYSDSLPDCPQDEVGGTEPLVARFIGSPLQEAGDSFNIALVGSGLSVRDTDYEIRVLGRWVGHDTHDSPARQHVLSPEPVVL